MTHPGGKRSEAPEGLRLGGGPGLIELSQVNAVRDKVIAILRIGAGFLLVLAGLFLSLPGIPGPGLLVVVLGLALLSPHFTWARRLMEWGKAKLEAAKERIRGKAQSNPGVGE